MFMQNAKRFGFDVTGVEPIREAYLHISGTLGLPVVHGDLYSAALEAERFSAVSLLDVIEHISDPVAELREVLCVKTGRSPGDDNTERRGVDAANRRHQRRIFGQPWCPIDDVPWHLWGFTPQTIRLCMEKAGFHVEIVDSLEPSPLSSLHLNNTKWKQLALIAAAKTSKLVNMSDRMVVFAKKGTAV